MALIPPLFLDTVVALGVMSQDKKITYTSTGFLYGYPVSETDEHAEKNYRIFLVTNRHVFRDALKSQTVLQARFNRRVGAGANIYQIELKGSDGSTSWVVHPKPDIDVAAIEINPHKLKTDGIECVWFVANEHTITLAQARTNEISEGDGVFVLGFPLGQAGYERNYTIVRQGIIARIQDWLVGDARTFLIDSSIFPGNSGGPVLLKPELTSIQGTKHNDRCALIGMVSSYLTYQEVAISQQTGRQRMVFEENSGLGVVVPYDAIQETIKVAIDKFVSKAPAD